MTESEISEPLDITKMLSLHYRELPVYSLAAQQNSYRLFSDLRLSYSQPEGEDGGQVLRDLHVELSCEGGYLDREVWNVSQIAPGQHVNLQNRHLRFSHDFLMKLTDETIIEFTLSVKRCDTSGDLLWQRSDSLTILPANFWGGETRQPELLAAFVKPNGPYVESLVKQVTQVLESNGYGRSADGYQSNTREKPFAMAAALWGVLANQNIAYVSPPPSYAHQGQLIRLASDISNNKMGACLDLSVLFASCLELMGLNTVIALTQNHAFVGVWLLDTMFPLLTNDDPLELRKRVDSKDLVLFESTMITNSTAPTFSQACSHARSLIAEDAEDEFVYAIDIAQARSRQIKPLATVEERLAETSATQSNVIELPPIPPLPPVRANERVEQESPETRIEMWQRRLLDLTKRNPLLAFKERTAGVRIFCPDIGQMEDILADGASFEFVSSELSPANDRERNPETFRLMTGNDLHENYALQQLAKNKLVANMQAKKLENTLISLFRKAKNDLEEGGANTLFLALGMLAWRENPEDDKVYRAPLILVPVELSRSSARAPIKLRQLADEEPLFNLTLIEFLETEYAIKLGHLRENLPEDDSGLDVRAIWQDVRAAISEQPGFEVKEECVVASFSFAKYLMWRDLRDRIDDLKENPFVSHMVEKPQEAYHQDSQFILQDQIDSKIDPTEIYIPLNADSSQIVAIEAASRSQDFVLEGPPGTGKSETIANMIANNLAKGRRVLFVAEKIAALQVVYRRLEKIGLDHLTLELHSNKANKKAVLDQLRRATEFRESHTYKEWVDAANSLRVKRDALNVFVADLHAPSQFGISPREAISRVVAFKANQKLQFSWPFSIEECPIGNKEDLERALEAAKSAGIAFNDVSDTNPKAFRPVKAVSWSYAWETRLIEVLRDAIARLAALEEVARTYASLFNIGSVSPTLEEIKRLSALSKVIEHAESAAIQLGFGRGVRERLERLDSLRKAKSNFDHELRKVGHGASGDRLLRSPVSEWIALYEEAKASWFKNLFVKYKINKQAAPLGYEKFENLEIVYSLKTAQDKAAQIDKAKDEFLDFNLWQGWDTDTDSIERAFARATEIHALIKQLIPLAEEPADLLSAIQSKLVDGRDFLDESSVVSAKLKFDSALGAVEKVSAELQEVGVVADPRLAISDLVAYFSEVIDNQVKLKPWVEWVAARNQLHDLGVPEVATALEAGLVAPEDAESQTYTAFCSWLAPCLIDERGSLRQFKASDHDQKLKEFRELDESVAKTTGGYIRALLAQQTPDIRSEDNVAHFGSLSRELQKKTRHKPIRALFEDMGERLLDLCPCLMMSPLSVAQFLPSSFKAFDVVIFDEASQMTTWDSVGAIARGRNVIVVGDPKQMPPTNFFSAAVDPDDPDEEDMESILDQALAAGLPHRRLMGHYRSRHETLIAFSNSKYYENALVTYPSADTKESAVTLHRVSGVYSKGKGRNNPIEARAIVDEAVRRLRDSACNHLSLGIVTLNTEQQRTIEDLLDDARRRHPEIEPYFSASEEREPVFVKNLESVQGDERDVIMFSLGYGPTEPGGKTMSMNFGPLNKQGGERRLNVAITRATTEVVVFASFDSSMIDLSRTSAVAVEHLKHYLEFAEKGPIALAQQSYADYGVDQFDSDFEQSVARGLRDRGWKVQTQVGVSKFRVDLGIVHPDLPGMYLAGVECDGATYHRSPSARDRDRTRHAILENLGWRLIRLWSTDYFRDPVSAINKIHLRLVEILEQDREKAAELDGASETKDDRELKPEPSSGSEPVQKVMSLNSELPAESHADQKSIPRSYTSDDYWDPSHKTNLKQMAIDILTERPCITLKALALEIANQHGMKRTSQKQLELITEIIKPWAGKYQHKDKPAAYWVSQDDVAHVIEWRGVEAFGYERDWSELAHPECLGLAMMGLEAQPEDPVDYICKEFDLKRRYETTLEVFGSWVDEARLLGNEFGKLQVTDLEIESEQNGITDNVDSNVGGSDHAAAANCVQIGSRVTVQYLNGPQANVVAALWLTDMDGSSISLRGYRPTPSSSPIGLALIDACVGDLVTFTLNHEEIQVKILAIEE